MSLMLRRLASRTEICSGFLSELLMGLLVGGAFGWTWGGACYIRYLFLPPNMRRQGLGTMLMREVEKETKSRNCHQIVLETHEFQALGFYQRLGFKVVSRVVDYARGHDYMTLVKSLA
jgi:ribosomal protein S18 acetylase RimI-like enzyme